MRILKFPLVGPAPRAVSSGLIRSAVFPSPLTPRNAFVMRDMAAIRDHTFFLRVALESENENECLYLSRAP